jgi:predicted esterase
MLTSQPAELHTIAATVHGRFLVRNGPPERLLVGFHGYAQNARIHLDDLLQIPGIETWTVASVQALHPFYARENIGASWMTSQDRELAIEDNIAYVRSVVQSLHTPETLVFFGFSQGAAMAYRAAASIRCDGVIALGGDVPPDVTANLPPVLIGRGVRDDWYTGEKLEEDLKLLESITRVTTCVYDGAHEWTAEFREAVARFLSSWPIASKS